MSLSDVQREFLHSLVDQYAEVMKKYCIRILGYGPSAEDKADEILQIVFSKAIVEVDKIIAHESALGWLLKSCRNVIFTEQDKQHRRTEILRLNSNTLFNETNIQYNNIPYAVSSDIALNDLLEAIKVIFNDEEQRIFIEVYLYGYTVKEASRRLGLPFNRVHGKIALIKTRLRKYFNMLSCFLVLLIRFIK